MPCVACTLRCTRLRGRQARPLGESMARITSEIPPADEADVAGADMTHLIVPITSDRGLCGGVNTQVIGVASCSV